VRIRYLIKATYNSDIKKDKINLGYGFVFSLNNQALYKFDHEITLTQKEKLLLTLLIQNINLTVPLEKIHEYVWENKEIEAVSMRSIIHKLQKKLKNGMIVNIRGVGYKLLKG